MYSHISYFCACFFLIITPTFADNSSDLHYTREYLLQNDQYNETFNPYGNRVSSWDVSKSQIDPSSNPKWISYIPGIDKQGGIVLSGMSNPYLEIFDTEGLLMEYSR